VESKTVQLPDLLEKIIVQPDHTAELIEKKVAGMAGDREEILTTITLLIERFVEPAKALLVSSEDDPGQLYYDPQAIAGVEILGLTLGLLKKEFLQLQEPPEDKRLREALEDIGIEIPLAETRQDFFRAWMALRTCLVIRQITPFLRGRINLSDQENQRELKTLSKIMEGGLPSLDRKLIKILIVARENK
jgi:hypothetical protein